MKSFFVSVLFLSVGTISFGQNIPGFFEALKNKDVNKIEAALSSDVDLCIESYQDFISKSEATSKIMQFLKKENPTKVESIHIGKSKKSGSNYEVANLICKSGEYRVFIYFEKNNNNIKISEIRFDK